MSFDWAKQCQSDASSGRRLESEWPWKWCVSAVCSSVTGASRKFDRKENNEEYSHSVSHWNKENHEEFVYLLGNYNFRLEIEDIRPEEKLQTKITPKPTALGNVTHKPSADYDDDLRKLIIPKKIVRSKLSQAVSSMQRLCSEQKSKKSPNQKQ